MMYRGFTLVELIVALGLFAFVMSISTGAYLIMIATNRQAQAVGTGINNLSYALDAMTRNMRTGSGYACPNAQTFTFVDAFGVNTTYRFVTGTTGAYKISQTVGGVVTDLTDQNVMLSTNSRFDCRGLSKTDGIQAHVVMVVSGTVSSGPGKSIKVDLQTTATRRGVDL